MAAGEGRPRADLSYSFRVGSLRNPVGPLPSSIYWRRRAVALSVVALLVFLAVWSFNHFGTGGSGGSDEGKGGGPAQTITPGPTPSGPAIGERPGGRDESGTSGGSTSGGTGGGGTGGGTGGGGDDGTSGGAGGGGNGGGGAGVPAGASLPDCTSGAVDLTLTSVKNTYGPDEKPKFRLTAKNSSGTACKVDFGPRAAVMTISFADDNTAVWASDDCPKNTDRILLQVPAKGDTTRTVEWDRKPSAPKCATPSARSAKPGTYLVEVQAKGLSTARVSFALSND